MGTAVPLAIVCLRNKANIFLCVMRTLPLGTGVHMCRKEKTTEGRKLRRLYDKFGEEVSTRSSPRLMDTVACS